MSRFVVQGSLLGFVLLACAARTPTEDDGALGTVREELSFDDVTPLDKVTIEGAGELDVESTYLPQVVCCEHANAQPEALKAQAVMARTYMAFRYFGEGAGKAEKPLKGTTADQAYFCNNKVNDACRAAVSATKGQITAYTRANGDRFANVSFFVDGPKPSCNAKESCSCPVPSPATSMTIADHPDGCDCFDFASQGAANPAYVTYNWSNSGTDVKGSTIGDPKNESNRGCASQNIQNCLAYAGWTYRDMLRFFYGQDIELRTMDGAEVADGGATPASSTSSSSGSTPSGAAATTDEGCSMARSTRSRGAGLLAVAVAAAAALAGRRRRDRA